VAGPAGGLGLRRGLAVSVIDRRCGSAVAPNGTHSSITPLYHNKRSFAPTTGQMESLTINLVCVRVKHRDTASW